MRCCEDSPKIARWLFQTFFICTRKLGKSSNWTSIFFRWVVQTPTRKNLKNSLEELPRSNSHSSSHFSNEIFATFSQPSENTESLKPFHPFVARSFKDAFLAASAEESTTKRLWVDDSPKGNISAVLERVELLSRPLPHTNQATKLGVETANPTF